MHPREPASPFQWPSADRVVLTGNEVHVWRAHLNVAASDARRGESSLSADERTRASAFRFQRDRTRFVVRRAVLRELLGAQLGVEPARLAFVYGQHGKPSLAAPFDRSNLSFNLSHSDDLALFALASGRPVGVDVESIRPISDVADLVRRYFSRAENAAIDELPPAERHQAFFNAWTRKEAYLKATGEGLIDNLHSVEVSLTAAACDLVPRSNHTGPEQSWSIRGLTPAPDVAGAIAAAGRTWTIHCWQWTARTS
jgi:4'-phosphopantetheinyl transferase